MAPGDEEQKHTFLTPALEMVNTLLLQRHEELLGVGVGGRLDPGIRPVH